MFIYFCDENTRLIYSDSRFFFFVAIYHDPQSINNKGPFHDVKLLTSQQDTLMCGFPLTKSTFNTELIYLMNHTRSPLSSHSLN